jgi:hypothetical protein
MAAIRHRKALFVWLAIAALLGNVVTGIICSGPTKRQSIDYPSDLLGALIICSEHGAQVLPSDDGDNPELPTKPCQICMTAVGFAFILVLAAMSVLVLVARDRRIIFDFIATFADAIRRAGLGSRAPPLPA